MIRLFCAYSTCYFSAWSIRRTWKRPTYTFDVVEQRSVLITISSRIGLRTSIHTDELCSTLVSRTRGHQVPAVFQLPVVITDISGRNREKNSSSSATADDERNIMILQGTALDVIQVFQVESRRCLELGSIEFGCFLDEFVVGSLDWIHWKAEGVGSSAVSSKPRASSYSVVDSVCSLWTFGAPPSNVNNAT